MGQRGLTLVELLVVIALASIVGGLIVRMFVTSNRTYMDQGRILDVQRSGRVAVDTMARLLREAGLDPTGEAGAGITAATATGISFTRDVPPYGTIGAADAETVEFAYTGTVLRRRYDGGPWVDMADKVSAFTLRYYNGAPEPEPLAFDAADNRILDASGEPADVPTVNPIPAAELDNIRAIMLTVTFQAEKTSGEDFARTYTTRIFCRNLYLQ